MHKKHKRHVGATSVGFYNPYLYANYTSPPRNPGCPAGPSQGSGPGPGGNGSQGGDTQGGPSMATGGT